MFSEIFLPDETHADVEPQKHSVDTTNYALYKQLLLEHSDSTRNREVPVT